ncbi:MAG TPA: hypothetical protein VF713_02900 [Thermoanaerobaculia bacterium]
MATKQSGVDKAMTDALRAGGVPKEALSSAISFVKELSDKGLKTVRGFPNGVPPAVETVTIEVHVAPNQLALLLPFLQRPDIRGLSILTKGVPVTHLFEAQFDLSVQR